MRRPYGFALLSATLLRAAGLPAPPPVMLWAWERPSDLRELPPSAGVAFLASSISFHGSGVRVTPRHQPLFLNPAAFRMAVVRIEMASDPQPHSPAQRQAAVRAIAEAVRITTPDAVQVDFDARASERPFYAALLHDLRTALGPQVFLSMTALVSWCSAHSWLETLPVDEVVPMAFEMGESAPAGETLLRSGGRFASPVCRASIGLALPDLARIPHHARRTYVFAYQDWTAALARSLLAQLP